MSASNKTENLVVGEIYKAKVIKSTEGLGGEALAKIDDFTVRVNGEKVNEGETIRVKITSVDGKNAAGNLVTNAADIF